MPKPKITEVDLCRAAKRLRTSTAEVETVAEVESKGEAFYDSGFPVILFERHKFYEYAPTKLVPHPDNDPNTPGGRMTSQRKIWFEKYPDICNPKSGGYGKAGQNQVNKFNRAFALDPIAAMKACSWGRFQLMGFNYGVCGFDTVGEMVDAMKESEGRQLDAFVSFVIGNGLADELRNHQWARFARGYNGAGYKKNNYDTKLANAYDKFKNRKIHCPDSAAAQPASKPNQPTASATDKGDQPTSDERPPDFTGGAAIVPPMGDPPPSLVAVQTPVVEVEQVKPEQESAIDTTITKWSARFVAIPTAALSFLGGIWAWMTNSPTELVMTLIIAGAIVAIIYFTGKQLAIGLENARKDRLQAAREARAHEIQKLTLESAMNKDMNTVRVVPQPLVNSDNPANEVVQ